MSACSIFWGRILWDVGSLPWYILHPQRLRLRETWQIEKMPFFLARDLACFPITVVFIGQLFFSGSFVNPVGHAVINRRFTLHIYIYIFLHVLFLFIDLGIHYIYICILLREMRARSPQTIKYIWKRVPVGGSSADKISQTQDVVSYNATITACEKGSHWEEAMLLLYEVRKPGDQSERKRDSSGRNASKMIWHFSLLNPIKYIQIPWSGGMLGWRNVNGYGNFRIIW